jgi:hypothetical protein
MSSPSSFPNDIKREQILGAYLDEIYVQLGMQFKKVFDKERQNKGIDIIVEKQGKQFLVDEKAQLDYTNRSLCTFAFEIGFLKYGIQKKGWLFDDKKETTHYMLVTDIFLKHEDVFTKKEDIASVKLLWINRKKLITFLIANGFDQGRCEQEERDAREGGLEGKIKFNQNGLYFYLSNQKAEAPFNVVIARRHLLNIGQQIFPLVK